MPEGTCEQCGQTWHGWALIYKPGPCQTCGGNIKVQEHPKPQPKSYQDVLA